VATAFCVSSGTFPPALPVSGSPAAAAADSNAVLTGAKSVPPQDLSAATEAPPLALRASASELKLRA
jgi:hypothetical protein